MTIELDILSNRLISALGNGVYQGLILTLVAGLLLKLASRTNAATRYGAGMLTLLIVAALPILHFIFAGYPENTPRKPDSSNRNGEIELDPAQTSSLSQLPQSIGNPSVNSKPALGTTVSHSLPEGFRRSRSIASRSRRRTLQEFQAIESFFGSVRGQPEAGLRGGTSHNAGLEFDEPRRNAAERTASETSSAQQTEAKSVLEPERAMPADDSIIQQYLRRHWQPSIPSGVALTVAAAWLAAASMRGLILLWQYGLLQSLKRRSPAARGELAERFSRLCDEMAVRRGVSLRLSDRLTAPVAAGFLHPAVLLPAKLIGDTDEAGLDGILRHELAHLKRADDWTNLVQQILRAGLFFHPAVLWLSRRLTLDREIACDDHVLAATRRPRDYALVLTNFASRKQHRDWAVAPAAWSSTSQLKERINMILDTKRNNSTRLARVRTGTLTAVALLTAAFGFHSGPRVALALDETNTQSSRRAAAEGASTSESTARIAVSSSASDAGTQSSSATISTSPDRRAESGRPSITAQLAAGPRPKSALAPADAPSPAPIPPILATPTPALPALPNLPALPTIGPATPSAPAQVVVSAPPDARRTERVRSRDRSRDSIEGRLRRLERLVESLLERDAASLEEKSKRLDWENEFEQQARHEDSADDFVWEGAGRSKQEKRSDDRRSVFDAFSESPESHHPRLAQPGEDQIHRHPDPFVSVEENVRIHQHPDAFAILEENVQLDENVNVEVGIELEKLNELTEKIQQQAKAAADRAQREAARALRLSERRRHEFLPPANPLNAQRRILEAQQKALEHQLRDIERQLGALETELDKLDEKAEAAEPERRSKEKEKEKDLFRAR